MVVEVMTSGGLASLREWLLAGLPVVAGGRKYDPEVNGGDAAAVLLRLLTFRSISFMRSSNLPQIVRSVCVFCRTAVRRQCGVSPAEMCNWVYPCDL